jgi:hypothetical protein
MEKYTVQNLQVRQPLNDNKLAPILFSHVGALICRHKSCFNCCFLGTMLTGNLSIRMCHINDESVWLPVDKTVMLFHFDHLIFFVECMLLLVGCFLREISSQQMHLITTLGNLLPPSL